MLINCPRCGFQQPKDQYCAQCGVDMDGFKAPSAPIASKIFSNFLLQFSILVLLAGGLGFILYQGHQDNIFGSRSANSTLQINASEKSTMTTTVANEGLSDSSSTAGQEANLQDSADGKNPDGTSRSAAGLAGGSNSKDNRGITSIHSPHLVVTYAEVSRSSLTALFEVSQSTGQFMTFKDYTAGILPNIEKKIQSIKILQREIKPLGSAKTLQWSYGLKDRRNPNIEIGLTTFLELGEMDGSNLRGNIEIQRTWREQATNGALEYQRKAFPAIFEIGSGNGFFLSGIMPLQSYLENEDELLSMDVFKILHSAQFRSGESEFVIFIEFLPLLK